MYRNISRPHRLINAIIIIFKPDTMIVELMVSKNTSLVVVHVRAVGRMKKKMQVWKRMRWNSWDLT